MLERKAFRAVYMMFPFVAGFIDRVTGFGSKSKLTTLHTAYTDLMLPDITANSGTRWSEEKLGELVNSVWELKKEVLNVFGTACSTGIYTLQNPATGSFGTRHENVWDDFCVRCISVQAIKRPIQERLRKWSERKASRM